MLYSIALPNKAWANVGLVVAFLSFASAMAFPAAGQELSVRETAARSATPPMAYAVLAEPGSPQIDGRLDDPVWETTMVISNAVSVTLRIPVALLG